MKVYMENADKSSNQPTVEFNIPEDDNDYISTSNFFGIQFIVRGLYGEKLNIHTFLGFIDHDKLSKYLASISNLDCIDYVATLYRSLTLYGNILPYITLKTIVNITKFSSPAQKLHRENNRKRKDIGFIKLYPDKVHFNQNNFYDVRIRTFN